MSRNKYAAKVDINQAEIVAAFRKLGMLVHPTHAAGAGFPDLVLGCNGRVYLVEVKNGAAPISDRRLTPAQVRFHAVWAGYVTIIENVEQAAALVSKIKGER
jgi:hypothetical protein